MPEECQENDYWQRHAEQPKQCTSSKTHDVLLDIPLAEDARLEQKFQERHAKLYVGLSTARNKCDLVAVFAERKE